MAAAAILDQEFHKVARTFQVGAIEDRAALSFRLYEGRALQDRKVAGERARWHIQVMREIAGRDGIRCQPDQLAEDLKARFLGKRPKR